MTFYTSANTLIRSNAKLSTTALEGPKAQAQNEGRAVAITSSSPTSQSYAQSFGDGFIIIVRAQDMDLGGLKLAMYEFSQKASGQPYNTQLSGLNTLSHNANGFTIALFKDIPGFKIDQTGKKYRIIQGNDWKLLPKQVRKLILRYKEAANSSVLTAFGKDKSQQSSQTSSREGRLTREGQGEKLQKARQENAGTVAGKQASGQTGSGSGMREAGAHRGKVIPPATMTQKESSLPRDRSQILQRNITLPHIVAQFPKMIALMSQSLRASVNSLLALITGASIQASREETLKRKKLDNEAEEMTQKLSVHEVEKVLSSRSSGEKNNQKGKKAVHTEDDEEGEEE